MVQIKYPKIMEETFGPSTWNDLTWNYHAQPCIYVGCFFIIANLQALNSLSQTCISTRSLFHLILLPQYSTQQHILFPNCLKSTTPSRNLRSSNMSLLMEPTSKWTWGARSFAVAAPKF